MASLDPIDGLIQYVLTVKPYHTKIIESLVEYVYTDCIEVSIEEEFFLDLGMPSHPEKWGWTYDEAASYFNCGFNPMDSEYNILGVNFVLNAWYLDGEALHLVEPGAILNFKDDSVGSKEYTVVSSFLSKRDIFEIQTINVVSLVGAYFTFSTPDNSYYVWFDTTGFDPEPTALGYTTIKVDAHDAYGTPYTDAQNLANALYYALENVHTESYLNDIDVYQNITSLVVTAKKHGQTLTTLSDNGTGFTFIQKVIGQYAGVIVSETIDSGSAGSGIAIPRCMTEHPITGALTPRSGMVYPPKNHLAQIDLDCGAYGIIYQPYNEWNSTENYTIGEKIEYNGYVYQAGTIASPSVSPSPGDSPGGSPSHWTQLGRSVSYPISIVNIVAGGIYLGSTPPVICGTEFEPYISEMGSPVGYYSASYIGIDPLIMPPEYPIVQTSWENVFLPGVKFTISGTGTSYDGKNITVATTYLDCNGVLRLYTRQTLTEELSCVGSPGCSGQINISSDGYDEPLECIKPIMTDRRSDDLARTFVEETVDLDWGCEDYYQYFIFGVNTFNPYEYYFKVHGDATQDITPTQVIKVTHGDNLGFYRIVSITYDGKYSYLRVLGTIPYVTGNGWIEEAEPWLLCSYYIDGATGSPILITGPTAECLGGEEDFCGGSPITGGLPYEPGSCVGSPISCGKVPDVCLQEFEAWGACAWDIQIWGGNSGLIS